MNAFKLLPRHFLPLRKQYSCFAIIKLCLTSKLYTLYLYKTLIVWINRDGKFYNPYTHYYYMPPSAVAKTFFVFLAGCLLNDALASANLIAAAFVESVVPGLPCCIFFQDDIAPVDTNNAETITNFFIVQERYKFKIRWNNLSRFFWRSRTVNTTITHT